MLEVQCSDGMFLEMTESEMMYVEGGNLFDDICKGTTSILGGAVVKGAVTGAIKGSAAGPVGTVAGVIGGIVIAHVWDKVF